MKSTSRFFPIVGIFTALCLRQESPSTRFRKAVFGGPLRILLSGLLLALSLSRGFGESINLAGEWQFMPDPNNAGLANRWFDQKTFSERLHLPGCMQAQGFGDKPGPKTSFWVGYRTNGWLTVEFPFLLRYNTETNYKNFAFLMPEHHYIGAAWYARDFKIPAGWESRHLTLNLERCHWETRVWLDGNPVGRCDGLAVPHQYDLPPARAPGAHRLVIRVDNGEIVDVGENSHSVSDQTAGTWNGIVGKIELVSAPRVRIDDAQVFPSVTTQSARVVVTIRNDLTNSGAATLTLDAECFNSPNHHHITPQNFTAKIAGAKSVVEMQFPLGADARTWDEFSPALYRLKLKLTGNLGDRSLSDTREVVFGLREIATRGTQFTLNGHPIFLRGNVDCAVFPKTGYAPMDVAAWRKVWRTHKAFGFNAVRFHSWCPPEAAFAAADEVGILLAPEVSEWSWVTTPKQEDFFRRESAAMFRQFGNHPSFALMGLGNELGGDTKIFERLLTEWKKDPRRVYSLKAHRADSPTNPPAVDYETQLAFGGEPLRYQQHWTPQPTGTLFQTRAPQTEIDWRAAVTNSAKPIMVHEAGQFCAFPEVVDEPKEFTGYLKPVYADIVRDGLRERGMLDQLPAFVCASGEWQQRLYREEMESYFRTPGLAGYFLLELNDFTGQDYAPVGLCNAFYEPKCYVKPVEFGRFNAATVLLARLPRRVWTEDQNFTAGIELSHFGPETTLRLKNPTARIRDAQGRIVFTQNFPDAEYTQTNCQPVGCVTTSLAKFAAPTRYSLEIATSDGSLKNNYDFWVFPKTTPPEISNSVHIVSAFDDTTRDLLNQGDSVLLLPKLEAIRGSLPMAFTTMYWKQFGRFGGQSSGNGILLDPKHPAFASFPTAFHTDWQWWDLLTRCRPMILDGPEERISWPKNYRPLVQLIDGWKTNRKLAFLVEARVGKGRLAICSLDLESDLASRPAARQFRSSLLSYLNSPVFNPQNEIAAEQIDALFRK